MKRLFQKKSFHRQVLLCMILFAVVPSVLVGLVSNSVARSAMQTIATDNSNEMLARVCADLDNVFVDTYNIGVVIANDIDIQSILRSRFGSVSERYSADLRGDTRLNFISSYKKDIYGLYVIGANGCKHKSRFTSFKDGDFTQEEWYQTIFQADGPVWFGRHDGSFVVQTIGDSLISGGFAVVDKATGEKNGVILYDIAEQRIQDILQSSGSTRTGMMILDANRQLITSTDGASVPKYYQNVVDHYSEIMTASGTESSVLVKDPDYLIQCRLSHVNGWLLAAAVPKAVIFARSSDLGKLIGVLLLGVCMLGVFISFHVSARLTRPVSALRAAMRSVRHGDLTVSVQEDSEDELGQLSRSFNTMVVRLHELMEKSLRDESRRRKAELVALQSQINPHFLYNTLDAVIWMARREDTVGIINMVTALTRFFRISLSKGKDFIPLTDELAHVASYLTIQQTRYQEKLRYELAVEDECLDVQVPKLILQPIVENAIYHGLKLKEGNGCITIRGCMIQEELVMEVEDTGIGMLPERLAEIQQSLLEGGEDSDGYGLRNIHERLRLCYGESYGLQIASEYLFGTTISFQIPKTRRENGL